MRRALADPWVATLVLLSESCAPIWPAAAAWLTLAAEKRSRVNTCANASDPSDDNARMAYRWQPAMAAAGVARHHWRKSSQWVALRRRHAEAVLADGPVNNAFASECYVDNERNSRFCVSGEPQ